MDQNLLKQWQAISENETDWMVNSSQFCALIKQQLEDVSWCVFYWNKDQMLVVGAYQGPLACARIACDAGVCGAAYTQKTTQIVDDVNQFIGHIACDGGTASEIVVPIIVGSQVIGVFDIDSYILKRFDQTFANNLEQMIKIFVENTQFPENFRG